MLASRLHVPVAQLRARRRELGLNRAPTRRYAPEDDRAIRALWAAGETLARRLGPSPRVVVAPCPNTRTPSPGAAPAMDKAEDALLRDGYAEATSTAISDARIGSATCTSSMGQGGFEPPRDGL
jgi:hypothetical protein